MKRRVLSSPCLYFYTTTWISYLVLRFFFKSQWGLLALMSNFIPVILLPVVIVPIVGYKRRDWLLTIAGTLLIVFLLVEYGNRFLPKSVRQISDEPRLTVLSHNTGQNLPEYKRRYDLILQSNADIVLLQEITEEFMQSYGTGLAVQYPYIAIGPLQTDRDQAVGMALLSKHPIVSVSDFKLAEDGLVFQQRAVVNYKGDEIAVYNVHTTFPWFYWDRETFFGVLPMPVYDDSVRDIEISKLAELIQDEQTPVLIGGDFNFGDQSDDYHVLLGTGVTDAYRKAGYGFGFTWPVNRTPSLDIKPAIPFIRVDYVFHSVDFSTVSSRVLDETGSDHRPVWVELMIIP